MDLSLHYPYGGFLKLGYPNIDHAKGKILFTMDDSGVPPFQETTIYQSTMTFFSSEIAQRNTFRRCFDQGARKMSNFSRSLSFSGHGQSMFTLKRLPPCGNFRRKWTIQTSPKWWCLWILKVSFEGWWTFHPTKWRKWAIFFGSLWKFEIAMTPPFLL